MRVVSFYRNVDVMLQNAVTVLKNSKLLFMRFCDFTILSGFYYERFCCIELLIARPARLALFTRRLLVNLILKILGKILERTQETLVLGEKRNFSEKSVQKCKESP